MPFNFDTWKWEPDELERKQNAERSDAIMRLFDVMKTELVVNRLQDRIGKKRFSELFHTEGRAELRRLFEEELAAYEAEISGGGTNE
jgi:hypothetical protein